MPGGPARSARLRSAGVDRQGVDAARHQGVQGIIYEAMAVDPASPEFERKVIGLIAKKKKLDPTAIAAASTFQDLT